MPFPFQKMQLEAPSLYALISTWAETQLVVEKDRATIIGYGYQREIAGAFSLLVFDWEATISLDRSTLAIQDGTYGLIRAGDHLLGCKDQQTYPIPDQAVRVEVLSVLED